MILSKVPLVDFLFDLKNWRRFDSKKYSRIEIIWKITILIGDTSSFMVGIFRCHVRKLGGVSPSSSWSRYLGLASQRVALYMGQARNDEKGMVLGKHGRFVEVSTWHIGQVIAK